MENKLEKQVSLDVLLPADLPLPGQRIAMAANVLSHLSDKYFSSFFLQDCLAKGDREKFASAGFEKISSQQELETEAKSMNLDIQLIESCRNPQSIHSQSLFADILIMSFLAEGNNLLDFFITDKFLDRVGCPILFSFGNFHIPEEIIFLFDFEPSSLTALKSFASIFGDRLHAVKVTIVTASPEDENAIFFEKCLIKYAQKIFTDIGVIPVGAFQAEENLMTLVSKAPNPWLIMGKMTLPFLDHHRTLLKKNPFSIYSFNLNQ